MIKIIFMIFMILNISLSAKEGSINEKLSLIVQKIKMEIPIVYNNYSFQKITYNQNALIFEVNVEVDKFNNDSISKDKIFKDFTFKKHEIMNLIKEGVTRNICSNKNALIGEIMDSGYVLIYAISLHSQKYNKIKESFGTFRVSKEECKLFTL